MPVAEYFAEQLQELSDFLSLGLEPVRILRIDPETHDMFLRALAGLEGEAEFPHMLIGCYYPFTDPDAWFQQTHETLDANIEEAAAALAAAGVSVEDKSNGTDTVALRLIHRAEAISEQLPDHAGTLAFLIEPENIKNPQDYVRSIEFLAARTTSDWVKYIVVTDSNGTTFDDVLKRNPKISVQTFKLPIDEIEKRQQAAEGGGNVHGPGCGHSADEFASAIAFANKDYSKAEKLQRKKLAAKKSGGPKNNDTVFEHIDLGVTLMKQGALDDAITELSQACDLACGEPVHGLAPTAFLNLAIALHKAGQFDGAFSSLRVANDFYAAQNNKAAQAHCADTLATIYQERGQKAEAEAALHHARSVYDSIDEPGMDDVRVAGLADIDEKLKRMGGNTRGA